MSQRKSLPEEFIENTYCPESAFLARIRERLQADGKEGINVSAHEGKLLQLLVKISGARTVLEVGTLYGYSTLWLAEAVGAQGRVTTLELSAENARAAQALFVETPFKDRIELIEGDALESMQKLSDKKYDFIFIDANKSGYPEYLKWAMQMVNPGGLIVGDNTFLFGHMYGKPFDDFSIGKNGIEAMRVFHQTLAQSKDFFTTMIPTHQGLTVAWRTK